MIGTRPAQNDPLFVKWDEEDSMIMLWNSMLPEVSKNCMFLTTTREIWETVCQTYSKMHDASFIYNVKTRIKTIKQGTLLIIEYYNIMKGLCLELDYY